MRTLLPLALLLSACLTIDQKPSIEADADSDADTDADSDADSDSDWVPDTDDTDGDDDKGDCGCATGAPSGWLFAPLLVLAARRRR